IVWNIAWVGNVSLISVLATNPEERGFLSSRRATWTSLAGVFFSYIGQPLAIYIGNTTGNEVLGYTLLAGAMAFLMMLGYYTVFKMTEGYELTGEQESERAKASPQSQKVSIRKMFESLFKNPPLIVLLAADFFRFMTFFIITAAAMFYFEYVAQNAALMRPYLLTSSIAAVLGAYMSASLIKKLTTRTTAIVGLLLTSASLIIGNYLAMDVTMFFVFAVLARLFLGLLGATLVALYTDTAVYSEWKTGENATPFVMGLMNLSLKTAIISRGTVIPIVLAAVGFVAGADPATASDALKKGIISVNMVIPGVLALIAACILALGYKLTRERVATLQEEIDAQKP
ncbi:MAG: MFS transporter, partial [Firmicutes bacterium]|nr:MFS transporter [Bacillota bacterium]